MSIRANRTLTGATPADERAGVSAGSNARNRHPSHGPAAASPDGAALDHYGAADVLELQRTAGNRAVSGLVVQRHPAPTTNEEVGAPAEDSAAGTEAPAADEPAQGGDADASPAADSQPATGTGTTGTTGTTALTGEARKTAIETTLDASDTGKWARAIIKKWDVPVNYEYAGSGSYHQGGKIYINKTLPVGGAALVLMHEAQHADTFKSGKGADREKLSREDYVKASIADEAEAVVRQVEGMAVTKATGADISGAGVTDALKKRYLDAFYAKRDQLKAANPTMTTAQINAECRKATRDGEVTSWFHDGTFVTSTDNNSYAVFYGKQWDEVHTTPGAGS